MKTHTTNYQNTFIEIAEDSTACASKQPPQKPNKTVAEIQFELISKNPYKYTSDDVIFETFAQKNDIPESEKPEARKQFFLKGQACMRCSPLTKTYGFGVHNNAEGKIALIPVESKEYQNFLKDESVEKVKAMRSKKA